MNIATNHHPSFTPVKPTSHLDKPIHDVEKKVDITAKTKDRSKQLTFVGELEHLGKELRNDDKRHKNIVEDAMRAYEENSFEPLNYPHYAIQNDSPFRLGIDSAPEKTISSAYKLASDTLSTSKLTAQNHSLASTAVMMALRSKMVENHQSREQLFADAIKAYTER